MLLIAPLSLLPWLTVLSLAKELSLETERDNMLLCSSCEDEQTEVDSESSLSHTSGCISKIELLEWPLLTVFSFMSNTLLVSVESAWASESWKGPCWRPSVLLFFI